MMVILKHIPHQFEWKILDPNEKIISKQGGKGKKNKNKKKEEKLSEISVKSHPILLTDGAHIGVRLLLGPTGSIEDDYQTEEDRIAGENFRILSEQKRKEKEEELKLSGKYTRADSHGVRICLDDEEEERQLAAAIAASQADMVDTGAGILIKTDSTDPKDGEEGAKDAKDTSDTKDTTDTNDL